EEKLLRWLAAEEEQLEGERVFIDVVCSAKRTLGEIPRLVFTVHLSGEHCDKKALTLDDLGALDEDLRANHRQMKSAERRFVSWLVAKGAVRESLSVDRDPAEIFVKDPAAELAELAREQLISWKDGAPAAYAEAKLGMKRSVGAPPQWAVVFPGASL